MLLLLLAAHAHMDWLLLVGICAIIGAASGFIAGLLGVGGGLVLVPALILLFDLLYSKGASFASLGLTTTVAVATSLACVFVTTVMSGAAQWRRGHVHLPAARRWAPFLVVGGAFSGWFAPALPEIAIRLFIAVLVLTVAIILSTRWQPKPGRNFPGRTPSALMAGFTGFFSGVAGIAGGNMMVPTFMYFNLPIHHAMGTSSFLGPFVALSGVIAYISRGWAQTASDVALLGFVHLPAFAAITLGALFFAPLGVRFAHGRSPEILRTLLVIFLIAASLRMSYSALDVF